LPAEPLTHQHPKLPISTLLRLQHLDYNYQALFYSILLGQSRYFPDKPSNIHLDGPSAHLLAKSSVCCWPAAGTGFFYRKSLSPETTFLLYSPEIRSLSFLMHIEGRTP